MSKGKARESPSFPSSLWAQIHKHSGEHYRRRNRNDVAIRSFQRSLVLKKNSLTAISKLTKTKCEIGDIAGAVEIFKKLKGSRVVNDNLACNLQECDCYYDSNQFEENMLEISNKASKFRGFRKSEFDKRYFVVSKNFDDTIGKNAGLCLFDQRKHLEKMGQKLKSEDTTEFQKSAWKILRENDECDVVSIFEVEKEKKSIREQHRLKKIDIKFAQIYLQSAWQDYNAMIQLQNNQVILDSIQNMETNSNIKTTIEECLETTKKFMKMLHARCPMYTYQHRMYSDASCRMKQKQITDYRIQFKVRREMFNQLIELKSLRDEGQLGKLIQSAEKVLGYYYQIVPEKYTPRKEEFITEICNVIGLAHLDKIEISENYRKLDKKQLDERLATLFNVSLTDKSQSNEYKFGVQSTYRDPGEPDHSFIAFKNNIDRLDARLKTAYLPIEKCYLYHEIAKQNVKQGKFDEVRNFGKKIDDESEKCGSLLWKLLGVFVTCKADILQRNVLKILSTLSTAQEILEEFQDEPLQNLVDTAMNIAIEIQRKSETSIRTSKTQNETEDINL